MQISLIKFHHVPGGLALVGDKVEVGTASEFTTVAEDTVDGPSLLTPSVALLRLMSSAQHDQHESHYIAIIK